MFIKILILASFISFLTFCKDEDQNQILASQVSPDVANIDVFACDCHIYVAHLNSHEIAKNDFSAINVIDTTIPPNNIYEARVSVEDFKKIQQSHNYESENCKSDARAIKKVNLKSCKLIENNKVVE